MKKKYRLVMVDWIDSHAGPGWQGLQQLTQAAYAMPCRSVGWLIKSTKESALIVPHVSGDIDAGDVRTGRGDLSIPHCSIKRMRTLKF